MTMTESRWFHPRGRLARDGWESVVDESTPGWAHTGIRIAEMQHGQQLELPGGVESIVVPLSGSFVVSHGLPGAERSQTVLFGRSTAFAGPTDIVYLGSGEAASLRGVGRVAVATSPTADRRPSRYVTADEVAVEIRGAGASSRQVHNFGIPGELDAARLIVCEVVTPAGNWSSYPPHKHDEYVPGRETRLEEIYYFETQPVEGSPAAASDAFGLFTTYSSVAGEIEIEARVRSGDIALVPFGYHGPAVAAPGYDLYYLNVMAGPDPDREWLISDDPAHGWIRDSWNGQQVDPRLPFPADSERTFR